MRVLTFSTAFPTYHPKAGQPTHFVEKIWKAFMDGEYRLPTEFYGYIDQYTKHLRNTRPIELLSHYLSVDPKYHTIRAGKRWKVGDWFSPRIWSGKAYRSPQIEFAPPIQVKKTFDIVIGECGVISVGGFYLGSDPVDQDEQYERLAKNDGLTEEDLLLWFPTGKRFDGQIICWNDKIEY